MAVTDRTNRFPDLNTAAPPIQVPNSVSRSLRIPERSFTQVVQEAGKAVTDAELNLHQDLTQWANRDLLKWQIPSGWLRGFSRDPRLSEIIVGTAPPGLSDDGPGPSPVIVGTTLINALVLPKLTANVAGFQVTVEYTYTQTPEYNLVVLEAPTIYDGTPLTFKRTDFVYLEVWQALVATGIRATGTVTIGDSTQIVAGDTVVIFGIPVTATAVPRTPGLGDFQFFPGNDTATAADLAAAINDPLNPWTAIVTANAVLNDVTLTAVPAGSVGNLITTAVVVVNLGSISVSGLALAGGADRPNKPTQSQIYRHGNVLSPVAVALDDEMNDPLLNFETSQRVQVQYRIRVTGATDGVNFKTNPDGFSSAATITAQGCAPAPVPGYPFVPANNSSSLLGSDATAYGVVDSGLWIAGDGSQTAAQALGAVDGFVYAIPICFVFRHNDAGDPAAAVQGWDPLWNTNGAPTRWHGPYVGPLGPVNGFSSDRPDGNFCDMLSPDRILDLRRHVMPVAPDLGSELQYQIQSPLDGTLRTWAVDTSSKQVLGNSSGDVSTQYLVCDEVGRTLAKGGFPPSSGDTGRGMTIRNFDHIARRFGDQSVVERVVFAFYPGDRTALAVPPGINNPGKYVTKAGSPIPGWDTTWYEGDVLHIDLTLIDSSFLGGFFQGLDGGGGTGAPGVPNPSIANMAPPGTVISDVLSVYHDDGDYNVPVDQRAMPALISGLGTQHLEITLDANDTSATGGLPAPAYRMVGSLGVANGSPRRIFIEVEITYPIGEGISCTPDLTLTPDSNNFTGLGGPEPRGPGPIVENNITQRPADFDYLEPPGFRSGYREAHLEYVANGTAAHGGPVIGTVVDNIVSSSLWELRFPRRPWAWTARFPLLLPSVVEVPVPAIATIDLLLTEFGSSSRKVVLAGVPLSGAGHTQCDLSYRAQDPIPNYGAAGAGYQVALYYRSNAPQTAGVKDGVIDTSGDGTMPETLVVEPLSISPTLWTGQVGMGSVDRAFPYESPLDQLPTHDGIGAPTTEEWYFTATASIVVDDFDASTGLLALHSFVQADGTNLLQLGGTLANQQPRKDAEFRAYYPFADDLTYRPTIMSQPLYGIVRHKVFVPILARATADVPNGSGGLLYRHNEILLVVLTRFAELDDENTVRFIDPPVDNRTSAAVYRTRNMLMVAGG